MKFLPSKILLVRPDAIGDVVLMIPLINTLKKTYPQAKIYVLAQSYTADLLKNHPAVTDVILDWRKAGRIRSLSAFVAYVRFIKSYQFDMVVFSYLDFFYAFLMFLARVPVRLGDANKILIRPLLNAAVKQDFRNVFCHETEQNIQLLLGYAKKIGQKVVIDTTMDLAINPEDQLAAEALLQQVGLSNKKKIGIHPTSGGGNRAWLTDKYAALIDLIHSKTDYQVLLTGSGKKDAQAAAAIMAASKTQPVNLVDKTSLGILKAVVATCQAFIGTDTGPTHIAAAFKVPVLCVSPTKFVKSLRWGPWQTRNRICGRPQACLWRCYPYTCKKNDCLDAIPVSAVFDALLNLFKESQLPMPKPDAITKQNKRQWCGASMNLGIYVRACDDATIQMALGYSDEAQPHALSVTILCANARIALEIQPRLHPTHSSVLILIAPLWRPWQLLREIMRRDLNLMRIIPSPYLNWPWIITQLAALGMYCPPIIIKPKQTIASLYEDVIIKS